MWVVLAILFLIPCVGQTQAHPSLSAIEAEAKAVDSESESVGRWPEPVITLGYFPGMYHISVMQMIPWPGKLGSMRDMSKAKRPMLDAQSQARERALNRQAEEAMWDLWLVDAVESGFNEQLQLLEAAMMSVKARVEVGAAKVSSLQQLQLQITMLQNRKEALQATRTTALATLAYALGEDVPREVRLEPKVQTVDDVKPFLELAAEHPRVKMVRAGEGRLLAEEKRASVQGMPDFSIGFQAENTEHPYMAMVSVSLPLWRGSYAAASELVESKRVALGHEVRALEIELQAQIKREIATINDTARQIGVLETSLIPLAEGVYHGTVVEVEQGGGMSNLLMAQRDLIDLRVQVATLQVSHQKAWVRLRELVGND